MEQQFAGFLWPHRPKFQKEGRREGKLGTRNWSVPRAGDVQAGAAGGARPRRARAESRLCPRVPGATGYCEQERDVDRQHGGPRWRLQARMRGDRSRPHSGKGVDGATSGDPGLLRKPWSRRVWLAQGGQGRNGAGKDCAVWPGLVNGGGPLQDGVRGGELISGEGRKRCGLGDLGAAMGESRRQTPSRV